jgi:ABC-type phosphate transport system auxiliary subunit
VDWIKSQYAHREVAITGEMQDHFDSEITASNGVLDATQRRLSGLEDTVERQARTIRDLQGLVQHLQFKQNRPF